MTRVHYIIEILDAIGRSDWKEVHTIVEQIAETEKKKKHFDAAYAILEALDVTISKDGLILGLNHEAVLSNSAGK